jgi:hypothetical protein
MIFDMIGKDNKIHPSFRAMKGDDGGTRSGRFASNKPNLQQVPARDPEIGPLIRSLFIPEQGKQWGVFDYCFSDDTEVLTENGFKLFKDLSPSELVYEYDVDQQQLNLSKPISYQAIPYVGDMEHIQGKFIDMLVSPNHNCLLFNACNLNRPEIHKADDYKRGNYGQLNAAKYEAGEKELKDVLILVAAIQADAGIEANKRITFSLKKQRKIDRLLATLDNLDIPYNKKSFISKPGFSCIRIKWEDALVYVDKYLDISSRVKDFKRTLCHLDISSRQFFVEELTKWDGSVQSYVSTNTSNVYLAQEIATISGIRSTLRVDKTRTGKPMAILNFSKHEAITWTVCFKHDKKPYSGNIYCVTMPCSTVVVRRNGKVFITSNSQQEPRVTVHYARITKEFLNNAEHKDYSRITPLASSDQTKETYINNPSVDYHQMIADMAGIERKPAKTLNLGAAYGMGRDKMMTSLGVDMDKAIDIYNKYHEAVPYVKALGFECMAIAQNRGWVKTLLGRKRRYNMWEQKYQEKYDPKNPKKRPLPVTRQEAVARWGADNIKRAKTHNALNAIVQGSSADMLKLAMVMCHEAGHGVMHMTIHDELDFSVEPDEVPKIKEIMEHAMELVVPLKVDVETGPSWGEAK